MEQIRRVTIDFIIPIGLVMGLFAGFYQLGQIANQVDVNSNQITSINNSITSYPTRAEFTTLLDDIKYIKNNLD